MKKEFLEKLAHQIGYLSIAERGAALTIALQEYSDELLDDIDGGNKLTEYTSAAYVVSDELGEILEDYEKEAQG
ncbi:MAG: hypothetical protein K6G73_12210 [Marinilabiliaceae bacterium]|nr:hypothetical protein [Marinilabiliaceae bacterium]